MHCAHQCGCSVLAVAVEYTKVGTKLTTNAQVVSSGGTSLQSQLAAKAALSGRGGACAVLAADGDLPAVLELLGSATGLLGLGLGLFELATGLLELALGLLLWDDGDWGLGAAEQLHRPHVFAQKPLVFVGLVFVMKPAEHCPKPFCIAEQTGELESNE